MTGRIWTVPNQITLLRLGFLPLFLILIVYEHYRWALLILVLAGLSDGIDGLLARKLDQKSAIGAYLDPIADKLLLSSCGNYFDFRLSPVPAEPSRKSYYLLPDHSRLRSRLLRGLSRSRHYRNQPALSLSGRSSHHYLRLPLFFHHRPPPQLLIFSSTATPAAISTRTLSSHASVMALLLYALCVLCVQKNPSSTAASPSLSPSSPSGRHPEQSKPAPSKPAPARPLCLAQSPAIPVPPA